MTSDNLGWIRGTFDGDYHGRPLPAGEDAGTSFGLWIVRGVVEQPTAVEGPPPADEAHPVLHQEVLGPAWLKVGDLLYEVALLDVRIHQWRKVASVVRDGSPGDVVGRIEGVIWARLRHPAPPPLAEKRRRRRGLPQGDQGPREPALSNGQEDSQSGPSQGPPSPPGPTPRPSTGPSSGPLPWPSPGTEDEDEDEALGCLRTGCATLLAIPAFFFIWLSCGLALAMGWAALIVLVTRLHPVASVVSAAFTPTERTGAGLALVGAHAALVYYTLQTFGVAPCDSRSCLGLALLAAPMGLSALLAASWPRWATTLLWTVGLVVWCAQPDAECLAGQETATSETPVLQALERTLHQVNSSYEEALATDEVARLLGEQTSLLSVDDALTDSEAFLGTCGQALVLSGDILFRLDSDVLETTSEPHLRKLRRLVAMSQEAPIVVEGHADMFGAPLYNQDLSRRRAERVAAWLEVNARVRRDRLEVIGHGSERPLVTDLRLQHLNRRVEVSVGCE